MFLRKNNRRSKRIDCLIGAGTTVDGDIRFSGGLRVDGTVRGRVSSRDGEETTLVLSECGRIEGEIHVTHVAINGTVVGPVYAAEHAELQANAHVSGDIHYKTLEMQPGAVVRGKLAPMSEKTEEAEEAEEKVIAFKPASAD